MWLRSAGSGFLDVLPVDRRGTPKASSNARRSAGDENNLNIRVYGDRGSLTWHQERPDKLTVSFADEPPQVLKRGRDYLAAAAIKSGTVTSA
jgi:hypothetical protein